MHSSGASTRVAARRKDDSGAPSRRIKTHSGRLPENLPVMPRLTRALIRLRALPEVKLHRRVRQNAVRTRPVGKTAFASPPRAAHHASEYHRSPRRSTPDNFPPPKPQEDSSAIKSNDASRVFIFAESLKRRKKLLFLSFPSGAWERQETTGDKNYTPKKNIFPKFPAKSPAKAL